jgi:autotransporter-associated beta strand protein
VLSISGLTSAGGRMPGLMMPRCCQSSTVTRVALSICILAILFIQSETALAQCATTGTNPVTLTCATNTTTTNTSNVASPNPTTSDRTQDFNASIVGQINSGVTVNGFGLSLVTTLPGSTISVTNNGSITTNQNGFRALQVAPGALGNFGTFSYSGTGSITNTGNGDALNISNGGTGGITINVSGTSTIAAGSTAAGIAAGGPDTGSVGVTVQSGGTVQGQVAVSFGGTTNNTLTNSGTVQGIGVGSIGVSGVPATIINSGNITALARGAFGDNLTITNNLGGTIQATDVGGVAVQAIGTTGFANITNNTGATISATNTSGIAIAATTATVNNSGTISGAFDGVNTQNTTTIMNSGTITGTARSGVRVGSNASIDNSGTITGLTGIVFRDAGAGFGAPTNGSVFNSGTITGTGGTAINFAATAGAGPFSLTIASTSIINGNVLGTGADTFQLGGSGNGAFDVNNVGAAQQYRGFATFNKIGTSTWTLTGLGAQNWTISQGTLVGDTNSLGGNAIVDNAALTFNQGFTGTHSGMISGSGSLVKNGSGTVIFTADNTYSGGTTISAGVLQLGNGGVTGSIVGNVTDNAVLAINRSNAYTFASTILGTGAFQQNGGGTTDLTAINGYSGATTVNGGTLQIDGSIASSSLTTVNTGAALTGVGTVGNSMIANGGTFMPGNGTPGSFMTVSGNLAFQSGALYLAQLNPATASFANVTGTATLGGATVNAIYANGSYVAKKYTILTATSGVNGTFGSLVNTNLPANFKASLSYDAKDAFLNLTLSFIPPPNSGLNQNQQNVANAIVGFFNSNGGIPLVFGGLTPAGLTQAAGETATGSQQTTFDAMNLFMGVMTDPTIAGRDEGATPSTGAPQFAEEGDGANAYTANGKPRAQDKRDAFAAIYRKAPSMPDPFAQRWSVWAAGFGGSQTTDGNATLGSNSTTSRLFAAAVGADYRFSPFTLAGFALAGGGTNFGVNGLGSGRSDLVQAGAFIRHTVGPAYVSAALAYGWQDITTDRTVTIAGVDRLHAQFNANAFSGRVEGGYRFLTPWTAEITPYAAGQFTTFDLPAYSEQALAGANTFALSYGAKDVTASRSELGLRSDKSFAMQDAILTLRGRAAWAHDFNTDRNIAATFQTLPGASFVVNGAAQARDAALVTASSEMKWFNGFSLAATFEGEFANVTRSFAGKGVARYQW